MIDGIRDHLDLEGELLKHGYGNVGGRYIYPKSETGQPGVHILTGNDGVQRVYSHHADDPLAAGNLPSWCFVKAIDALDVVTILDFSGDRKKALHQLAKRFGIGEKPKTEQPNQEGWAPYSEVPEKGNATSSDQERPDGTHEREDHPRAKNYTRPDGWPEPVDFLMAENTASPILTDKHIPAAIWSFVIDTATRMGVDPTAVALCALVSCASVISDDWALQPKRFDTTWVENARLWGAIVGDPSILKSPVLKAATKPIDKLEVEARDRHKLEMREWRIAEKAAKRNDDVPPPRPQVDRYLVEGTTIEALSEVLRDDEEAKMRAPARKVLSRHDEMSEFFGALDRYNGGKGGSDRGAYLRLYNGGRFTIDRVTRGSFVISNWSACFLGGVQPGPIQRIAKDAADDGLLQRFIYCVPEKQGAGIDRIPNGAALEKYAALFPALAAMQPAPPIGSDHIRPIVFHADAHVHREDIDALVQAMSAMPDASPRLKSAFGKWAGLFARLCLTFHMIEVAGHRGVDEQGPIRQVISEATARQVATFMRDIVLPHLLRADAIMFNTEQTGHARWIAGYILAKKLPQISAREVVQAYKALRAPEARRELDAVMASLVSVAWLDPQEPSNPAKGVTNWTINPAVHLNFAKRAEVEFERRTIERDRIAEAVARFRAEQAAA